MNEPLWKQKELSRRTKLGVYDAIVVPALMYGSKTCTEQVTGVRDSDNRNDGVKTCNSVENGGQSEKCGD